MMAVVLVELGFTPEETTGLAVLSTMPGVIAHISEELRTGRPIRVVPEAMVDYGDRSEHDFATDRRSAGWPDGS
jgi:citryl-CoA lyase